MHVRLRGYAPLAVSRWPNPYRSRQIRKTKPDVVAEIDALLDRYCPIAKSQMFTESARKRRDLARMSPKFNLKKIAHIRQAFNLKCRYSRLRARGLLTAKEMSDVSHGVTTTDNQSLGERGPD